MHTTFKQRLNNVHTTHTPLRQKSVLHRVRVNGQFESRQQKMDRLEHEKREAEKTVEKLKRAREAEAKKSERNKAYYEHTKRLKNKQQEENRRVIEQLQEKVLEYRNDTRQTNQLKITLQTKEKELGKKQDQIKKNTEVIVRRSKEIASKTARLNTELKNENTDVYMELAKLREELREQKLRANRAEREAEKKSSELIFKAQESERRAK